MGMFFLCIGTIMMRNRVKCLECGKVLESLHMKDYQECNCSNHAYTSGGTHYRRCGAMRPSSLAIVEEDDSIRKYKSEIDYKK